MARRILVTGGAGLLGSHLCAKLVAQGHHVVCVDNFSTGHERHLASLQKEPRFELVRQDITKAFDCEVSWIFNLACPSSPVHYQADPVQTLKTNVHGSLQILELARRHQARVLQASTSEVYGSPQEHPQSESYWGNVNPIGPRSCYDEGKRCAETLFFDYHRSYGIEIKVARIFNTFGPHMDPHDGRVVSNFIMQALQGQDITVFGDGSQTRSFCYVADLVEGLLALMNSPANFTGPVNLGNTEETTMLQLAKAIIEATQSTSQIVHRPLPQDDPPRRKPNIELARRKLDWQPSTNLRDGLRPTIRFFEQLLATD